MSQSTDAILFYGYCWTREAPPWVDDYEAEDEDGGVAETRYLRLTGLAEKYPSFDYRRSALAKAPCVVVRHCSDNCTMYGVAVAGTCTTAWRGSPQTINPAEMTPKPEWAKMLRAYCDLMKIHVGNQQPAWHLVSWWG